VGRPGLQLMLEWSRHVLSLVPSGLADQRWPPQGQCRCLFMIDSRPGWGRLRFYTRIETAAVSFAW
jgi:hypothetical protein